MLSTYEDEETIDERLAEQKKISVILKISAALKKHKASPEQFLQVFSEQERFFSICSIVSLKFPSCVLQLAHEGRVSNANESEFWLLVSPEGLHAGGHSAHQFEKVTRHFVSEARQAYDDIDNDDGDDGDDVDGDDDDGGVDDNDHHHHHRHHRHRRRGHCKFTAARCA